VNVHHRLNKSPPVVPIVSQTNPVHPQINFFKTHLISPIYAWVFQVLSFSQVFPPNPVRTSLPIRATCPAHIILDRKTKHNDFITVCQRRYQAHSHQISGYILGTHAITTTVRHRVLSTRISVSNAATNDSTVRAVGRDPSNALHETPRSLAPRTNNSRTRLRVPCIAAAATLVCRNCLKSPRASLGASRKK
jgi:hypothetical protein